MSSCLVDPLVIINEIKTVCSGLYTTIREEIISETMLNIGDEQLDALLISVSGMNFDKQNFSSLEEIYDIHLLLLLKYTNTPFTTILTKQRETISAILNAESIKRIAPGNSLILKKSTASNIVKINNDKSKALSCIISFTCDITTVY